MKSIFKLVFSDVDYDVYYNQLTGLELRASARSVDLYKNNQFVCEVESFRRPIGVDRDGERFGFLSLLVVDY